MPPLFTVVLTMALVGLLVWVVVTYIPMPELFRRLLMAVVAILLLLWVARLLGVLS